VGCTRGSLDAGRSKDLPPSSASSIRPSVLLLTIIFLVWNILATANSSLREEPQVSSGGDAAVAASDSGDSAGASGSDVTPAVNAPLTVRRNHLLGQRVDINKAPISVIAQLPWISEKIAEAIVAERRRSGGFDVPEDLLRIKGIKEKRLKKILPFLSGFRNN
jgi:competence ComEA-like helix-hairpin-helix protein